MNPVKKFSIKYFGNIFSIPVEVAAGLLSYKNFLTG